MSAPNHYRILLAAPTILYFPVYLAWIRSTEHFQARVQFWTPEYSKRPQTRSDRLMAEFYENGDDVLLCVGDILRAYEYLRSSGRSAEWNKQIFSASLINTLPMAAYQIAGNPDSGERPVYMCHRQPMTSFEVAEFLSHNRPADLFARVAAGYEHVYVEHVVKRLKQRARPDQLRPVYLISPDVLATGHITTPVLNDRDIATQILKMGDDGSFLLTTIMSRRCPDSHLRDYFLGEIESAIDALRDDPDRCAHEFYQNIALLNQFGRYGLNDLRQLADRFRGFYSYSTKILDNTYKGIMAAARVRYAFRCDHLPSSSCEDCKHVRNSTKPFMRVR
jgi:hypothetical protein